MSGKVPQPQELQSSFSELTPQRLRLFHHIVINALPSKKTPGAENHQFMIVEAGGPNGHPEKGDREYLIIAANSGLYLTAKGMMRLTCLL